MKEKLIDKVKPVLDKIKTGVLEFILDGLKNFSVKKEIFFFESYKNNFIDYMTQAEIEDNYEFGSAERGLYFRKNAFKSAEHAIDSCRLILNSAHRINPAYGAYFAETGLFLAESAIQLKEEIDNTQVYRRFGR